MREACSTVEKRGRLGDLDVDVLICDVRALTRLKRIRPGSNVGLFVIIAMNFRIA
jgi:hypothetical protein